MTQESVINHTYIAANESISRGSAVVASRSTHGVYIFISVRFTQRLMYGSRFVAPLRVHFRLVNLKHLTARYIGQMKYDETLSKHVEAGSPNRLITGCIGLTWQKVCREPSGKKCRKVSPTNLCKNTASARGNVLPAHRATVRFRV